MNNPVRIKKITLFLLLVLTFQFISCGGLNIFPVTEDVQLGLQLNQEIGKNNKEYPKLNNPNAANYLQSMVNSILQSPDIKYRGTFAYKVEIINNDKVINAFATPGGYVYVYTGLLKMIDNEATIAAVLGHEIGHAEMRHATQRMTKAYGLQVLTDLALKNNTSKTAEVAANLFSGLALLKNSRDDEYEADYCAFRYLFTTNKWYPGAIKMFFDKIKDRSGSDAIKTLLSTHPLPPDRIEETNKLLKKFNVPPPKEDNLGAKKYRDFIKILG